MPLETHLVGDRTTMSSLARLDDYTTGHMSDDDAASFEGELFASPDDESVRFGQQLFHLLDAQLPAGDGCSLVLPRHQPDHERWVPVHPRTYRRRHALLTGPQSEKKRPASFFLKARHPK